MDEAMETFSAHAVPEFDGEDLTINIKDVDGIIQKSEFTTKWNFFNVVKPSTMQSRSEMNFCLMNQQSFFRSFSMTCRPNY